MNETNKYIIKNGRPSDETGRLPKEIRTYNMLDQLGIHYERVDHEKTETMEACAEIDKILAPAIICKNLFLCNSRKTQYYMLMIMGNKKFRTSEISRQIGSTRLSFGSPDFMEKYLDITPGSLSVLGLMNDTECRVQLLVDEEILSSEYFGCHPCINTTSMRMKTKDIFDVFLPAVGHTFRTVII